MKVLSGILPADNYPCKSNCFQLKQGVSRETFFKIFFHHALPVGRNMFWFANR